MAVLEMMRMLLVLLLCLTRQVPRLYNGYQVLILCLRSSALMLVVTVHSEGTLQCIIYI
jgi:hypothetical protein